MMVLGRCLVDTGQYPVLTRAVELGVDHDGVFHARLEHNPPLKWIEIDNEALVEDVAMRLAAAEIEKALWS